MNKNELIKKYDRKMYDITIEVVVMLMIMLSCVLVTIIIGTPLHIAGDTIPANEYELLIHDTITGICLIWITSVVFRVYKNENFINEIKQLNCEDKN